MALLRSTRFLFGPANITEKQDLLPGRHYFLRSPLHGIFTRVCLRIAFRVKALSRQLVGRGTLRHLSRRVATERGGGWRFLEALEDRTIRQAREISLKERLSMMRGCLYVIEENRGVSLR